MSVASPSELVTSGVRVSFVVREEHLVAYAGRLQKLLADIATAGLDGVVVGDHVSFHDGSGADGLIQAAAMLAAHETLRVATGIYLIPLRHPVLVARQVATLAQMAPGRFTFGVGVGGEDPHESEVSGVDSRTRGARADESLPLVRRLLSGEHVTHRGRFFEFSEAAIRPTPEPPVPIIVGGRSEKALIRAARHGDGWVGVWTSARRHREAVAFVAEEAERAGRQDVDWKHQHQSWCFFAKDEPTARARASDVMGRAYHLSFERFERYTPLGTSAAVAQMLVPYLEAGCRQFNLVADAESTADAIAGAGAVREILSRIV
jgi:alkanesulfonate monooxygenase SsuD/methylene tetrahydromethanopterin reductase-like flavin-dependent oxidoreductase (luciferase family)